MGSRTRANVQTAINAIGGFAGTVTVSGALVDRIHGHLRRRFGRPRRAEHPTRQPHLRGCFSSVEETNHGGTNDSFTISYDGNTSVPIVNGTNYSAAGILAALTPLLPAGATATVAGFGGGAFNNTGFQVTFTGTLRRRTCPFMLQLGNFSGSTSGFVGETDKGGAVDNGARPCRRATRSRT